MLKMFHIARKKNVLFFRKKFTPIQNLKQMVKTVFTDPEKTGESETKTSKKANVHICTWSL